MIEMNNKELFIILMEKQIFALVEWYGLFLMLYDISSMHVKSVYKCYFTLNYATILLKDQLIYWPLFMLCIDQYRSITFF